MHMFVNIWYMSVYMCRCWRWGFGLLLSQRITFNCLPRCCCCKIPSLPSTPTSTREDDWRGLIRKRGVCVCVLVCVSVGVCENRNICICECMWMLKCMCCCLCGCLCKCLWKCMWHVMCHKNISVRNYYVISFYVWIYVFYECGCFRLCMCASMYVCVCV